jgi:hypothetical protein
MKQSILNSLGDTHAQDEHSVTASRHASVADDTTRNQVVSDESRSGGTLCAGCSSPISNATRTDADLIFDRNVAEPSRDLGRRALCALTLSSAADYSLQ